MATTLQEHQVRTFGQESRFLTELSAGTGSEALAGGAAVVLSIVGLAGVEPFYMAAISTIAVGAALLLEGTVLMAKHAEMATEFGVSRGEKVGAGGGLTAEFLGGAAGIVLGILAIVHVFPETLISVAVLVYGATMLLGAAMTSGIKNFALERETEHPAMREMAHEAAIAASGAQALVALAALVLGILALVHVSAQTLALVAMLVLGGSILLAGSAMTTWMLSGRGHKELPHA